MYRIFLDKAQGPPAGALMAVLRRDFVLARLAELPCDDAAFWSQTATSPEQIRGALDKDREKIAGVTGSVVAPGRAEILATHKDGKVFVFRLVGEGLDVGEGLEASLATLTTLTTSPG